VVARIWQSIVIVGSAANEKVVDVNVRGTARTIALAVTKVALRPDMLAVPIKKGRRENPAALTC
jgi:hypothetical protein